MGKNWTPSRRTVLRLGTAGLAGAIGYATTVAALENELRIAAVGESASYEFAVSGDLEAGPEFDPDTDSISGSSGSGTIGGRGVDDFTFSGAVTDFSSEGPLRVFLNGEEVDPASLGSGNDDGDGSEDGGSGGGSDRTELIVSDPDGSQPNDYRFTVSGEVERLDDPRGDEADGDSASGTVYGGADGYSYSGEIVSFGYDGEIEATIDGEAVDPATLGSQGEDAGDDPTGDGDPSRELRVEAVGESARFEFTVSGDLEAGPEFDPGTDSISGSSGVGTIGGRGVDDFLFSGEIVDFSSEGPLRVSLDGTEIDPASLGSGNDDGDGSEDGGSGDDSVRTELVVTDPDGSQPNDYRFTVSGDVEALDDPRGDDTDGDSAWGTVYGGADGYSYSGEITSFSYDGDIEATIDGEAVDPATLGSGGGEDDDDGDTGEGGDDGGTSTLRIQAVGESTSYDFVVSGDLEAGPEFDEGTDSISGSSGAGTIGGRGVDDFSFSGEITTFSHDGPLRVFVGGEEVDPDQLGDGGGSGRALFVFDDGDDTALHRGADVLDDFGYDATVAVITERPKDDPGGNKAEFTTYLTIQELRELEDRGWEVCSHTVTHKKLTTIPESRVRRELRESAQWLADNGFATDAVVYPRGGGSDSIDAIAAEYYDVGFGGGGRTPPDFEDPIRIGRYAAQDPDEVFEAIDRESDRGGVVPIMLHDVVNDPSGNEIAPSLLRRYCEAIEAAGMDVVTASEYGTSL
jgi:peptidoglycan/xylan/chitin deacetylase (PgdA/CDA1 family)